MDRPSVFSNERSVASAGSGKTYSLTNRFIALASICDPLSVCALTFTRAAAGEFIDGILTKLARASKDGVFAKDLGAQISAITGGAVLSKEDFLRILKDIVRVAPRLSLSTIDAFEARFVGAFASELGIVGDIKIMDDFENARARKFVLNALLAEMSSDTKKLSRFAELVNIASLGRTQKNAFEKMDGYLKISRRLFLEFPRAERWGNGSKFASRAKFAKWEPDKYEAMLAAFKEEAERARFPKKAMQLYTFLKNSRLGKIYKGSKLTDNLWCFLRRGGHLGDFDFGAWKLPSGAAETAGSMLAMLFGASLSSAFESAKAVGEISREYEKLYRREIRLRGSLAFDDLSALISDANFGMERELVEYRLDSRFNHWLVDEFQDTSRAQWAVMENLVGELIFDGEHGRTFYYVGDPKQSIYAWRGGAPELFDEIFQKYKGLIRDGEKLNVSRRSVEPVIDAVNALFGTEALSAFNSDAANRWLSGWTKHLSHESLGADGCAALVRCGDDDRIEKVHALLSQIFKGSGGKALSCAVLVQTNSEVENFSVGLRELFKAEHSDVSVSGDADCAIAEDNMAVPAVLKLLQAAAHPGDSASEAYVLMTPLSVLAADENWRDGVLHKISYGGFEAFVRGVLKLLESGENGIDAFSKFRLSQLADAAAKFADRGGVDEFIAFVKTYKVREVSGASQVKVMTIHKSKGLDFEVVVLAQLGNVRGHDGSLRLRMIDALDGGKVVVNMPAEPICRMDKNLNAEFEKMLSDDALSQICKFYVAATRAKKALYLVSKWPEAGEKSSGKYSFERHAYGVLFDESDVAEYAGMQVCAAFGDLKWYEKRPRGNMKGLDLVDRKIEILENPKQYGGINVWIAPSKTAGVSEGKGGRDFGTEVHAILARIDYIGGDIPQTVRRAADAAGLRDESSNSARAAAERALGIPEIAALFRRADGLQVKCEYPFVCGYSGKIASGRIDRLNIYRDTSGNVKKLTVVDFKTGASGETAEILSEKYAGQMRVYAKAAKDMFPGAEVECVIADLSGGKLVKLKGV